MSWTPEQKHDYRYPGDLDWTPGSELHVDIMKKIDEFVGTSRTDTKDARAEMDESDRVIGGMAYYESEGDKEAKRLDPRNPVNIVVPHSLACLTMGVAHLAGEFLGGTKAIYQYEGKGGIEARVAAAKGEILLNQQRYWFKHGLSHITAFRDQGIYGKCAMFAQWTKDKRREPVSTVVTDALYEVAKAEGLKVDRGTLVRYLTERVRREGSELINIPPQALVDDPNVTLNRYGKSERWGFFDTENAMRMFGRERDAEEKLFNCKYALDYARELGSRCNAPSEHWQYKPKGKPGSMTKRSGGGPFGKENNNGTLLHLFWYLIPKDHKLGDGDTPELWWFKVFNGEVVVWAEPLNLDYGKPPVVEGGYSTTGHDLYPVSDVVAARGIQKIIDFEARSRIDNKRKIQSGHIVYDPRYIPTEPLNSHEGLRIPLKHSMFGTAGNIDAVYKYLPVPEFTQSNLGEMGLFIETMDRLLNNKPLLDSAPERPTAFGIDQAQRQSQGPQRLKSEIINEQYWMDLSDLLMCMQNQFMDEEMMINIIGAREEELIRQTMALSEGENQILVSKWDLTSDYSVRPISRMIGRPDQQFRNMLVERFLSIPEIAMQCATVLNIPERLAEIAADAGYPDVVSWVKAGGNANVQVMPDEQVAAQMDAGNLVPAGGMA